MSIRSILPLAFLSTLAALTACTSDPDGASAESDLRSGKAKIDVIFSPQPAEASHLVRIAQEIDRAESSIDIAIYSYSDANITARLAAAVKRGVKVRFIYEAGGDDARDDNPKSTTSMKLEEGGVDVRFVNKTMHHKLMIVDGPRDSAAKAKTAKLVTGSANWAATAATDFDENTLVIENAEALALKYQQEFDLMWAHSRDFEGKPFDHVLSTANIERIPTSTTSDVLFSSSNFVVKETTFSSTGTNTVSDALVAAIQGATKSIHVASGHLRSRPVSEALIAKKKASPDLDIRVYLDSQEYISKATHQFQLEKLETCLAEATTDTKRDNCMERGFMFGHQIDEGGVDVRYKYYAYRWDHAYAPQMHHKYMVIDGSTLWTGSYNLSANAEHDTFENMMVFRGESSAELVGAFEANFESMWKTGRDENKLGRLVERIENDATVPIVFEPMALTGKEVAALKRRIVDACPSVDDESFRTNARAHRVCMR